MFAVIGCGGSSSGSGGSNSTRSDTASSGPLTKAEFAKQFDAICHDNYTRVEHEYTPLFEEAAAGGIARSVFERKVIDEIAAPTYEAMIEEVRSLEGAKGDEKAAVAFGDEMEKLLAAAKKNPAVAFASIHYFTPAAEIAKEAGFRGCALIFGGQQIFS